MKTTTFLVGLAMAFAAFVSSLGAIDASAQSLLAVSLLTVGFAIGSGLCFIAAAIAKAKSDG